MTTASHGRHLQTHIFNQGDAMEVARGFRGCRDIPPILYFKDTFWLYTNSSFIPAEDIGVRNLMWKYMDSGYRIVERDDGSSKRIRIVPRNSEVHSAVSALKAECMIDNGMDPPFWLDNAPSHMASLDPKDFLSLQNGLLYIPTRYLHPHTPTYFCTSSSPVEYDPGTSRAGAWEDFLSDIFEHDPEAMATLQEWFGYNLTPDTSLQKIMLMIGPRRAGKGTIGRVLRHVLGEQSVTSMTLADLGASFGLQKLIGRPACIIPDARFSKRSDPAVVAERLLSISGEDAISIQRKFKTDWTGTLHTRFTVFTNEIPSIMDTSGALMERFLVLKLVKTFAGQEDETLFRRLTSEASSILNWAIEGYHRLRSRHRFIQPPSSADVLQSIKESSQPLLIFIEEQCRVGPALKASKQEIFRAWESWCLKQGALPGSIQGFGRDLRAVCPSVGEGRMTLDGKRVYTYTGISLSNGGTEEEPVSNIVHLKPNQGN